MITTEGFRDMFPSFRNSGEKFISGMLSLFSRENFPAGVILYSEGDSCPAIPFLLSGEIRIYKSGAGGREITLYEIGSGDTCILSASCILSNMPYPAKAVTAESVDLLLLPAAAFREMTSSHAEMRDFVFGHLNRRLVSVIETIEEVTFGRMDRRLMDYLIEKAGGYKLNATHQKIADDLGTSREVVSRLLKDFERKGMVILSRNLIELTGRT